MDGQWQEGQTKQQQTNDASHVSRPNKHRSNDWRNVEDIDQRHTFLPPQQQHPRLTMLLPAGFALPTPDEPVLISDTTAASSNFAVYNLIQLAQERGIPVSPPHLHYVLQYLGLHPGYPAAIQEFMRGVVTPVTARQALVCRADDRPPSSISGKKVPRAIPPYSGSWASSRLPSSLRHLSLQPNLLSSPLPVPHCRPPSPRCPSQAS